MRRRCGGLESDIERKVDVSDPTRPKAAGSFATKERANEVFVAGTTVYVAENGAGLGVYDISWTR